MIDSKKLLEDLQCEVTTLEDDLRARCDAEPTVDAPLKARYEEARARSRTALTYKAWREEELTNVAVAWVLACVFVRFLEDNGLVDTLHLAGPNAAGLGRARDQHELFFREHPHLTEREYLERVFTATAALPSMAEFFDRRHNPLWSVGPTGDAAAALVNFWRRADPETGRPVHDFADPEWNTRFLGDLYQDLSAAARKRYALLQTPVFVEQFILDRTLTPAIETFGFRVVRMIDPTCGSGHFMLGGFARLHKLWVEAEPAEAPAVLAQRALDQVFGVDLNPNVVAIARFRLLLAALRVAGTTQLRHAFNFRINVATGDSLLHGRRFRAYEMDFGVQRAFDTEEVFRDELKHHYEVEDVEALHRILGQQYHAVVGNPPYINVKDRAVSELYRARFPSCSGKYSLSVPFMERFFDLAVKGDGIPQQPAGFVGQITSNSFMKGEFGKKLIEEFIPRWDLTHMLDTSHVFIRDYGTPTVILFGKHQPPSSSTLRAAFGIKGEEVAPEDPATAAVWRALVQQIDHPGTQSEWMSVIDAPRDKFHKHPWSIGGGGAAELKETLDEAAAKVLEDCVEINRKKPVIGFSCVLGEDEPYLRPAGHWSLSRIPHELRRQFVDGEDIRDWAIEPRCETIFPYNSAIELVSIESILRVLWPARTILGSRKEFGGKTYLEAGRAYHEFHQIPVERNKRTLLITFGDVVTHNSFVLSEGLKLFNRHAPIIQLRSVEVEEHTRTLGLLNSSTACFYLKQVCHDKGGGGIGGGLATEQWEHFFAFNGTKLASFPIPARQPTQLPTALVKTSTALQAQSPAATLASWSGPESGELRTRLATARDQATRLRRQLIAWQEELDWQIYEAFGLVEGAEASGPAAVSLPEGKAMDRVAEFGLELGERAFEIVVARRMAAGEVQTTWFERHGSTPLTALPRHWPAAYRELVERRLRRIADDPAIRLIEQPEYKRRWNTEPWDEQFTRAARDWLLARLEGYFHEGQRVCELKDGFSPAAAGFAPATRPALTTTNQLAGTAQTDAAFLVVAEQLIGGPGFSVPKLVRELVESTSVPFLPAQRYKPSGLLKRHDWEHVWNLQRKEDAIEAEVRGQRSEVRNEAELQKHIRSVQKGKVGEIPVPPKYGSADFRKSAWWSLRGKLDVPKERWISYPGAERAEDPSPVIAWAGWDHAQQARALAEYYLEAKQTYAFTPEKLKLLLAGLLDLEPWIAEWHSAMDPAIGDSPANAIRVFFDAECHALGVTRADLEKVRMGT